MDPDLFAIVAGVARSLSDDGLGEMFSRSHKNGTKVWFGSPDPQPFHFEAQVMSRKHIDDKKGFAVEIGWHGEDRSEDANEAMLHALAAQEKQWRPLLGPEAVPGEFFNAAKWRRLSETWMDADLSEIGVDFEIGSRLADYINALQPLLNELPKSKG